MAQIRLNIDPICISVRRCLHTKNKCNECNTNTTNCQPIKTFSIPTHGVDGARKLAEEYLRSLNPSGKAAQGNKTFTCFIGTCSGEGCSRYICEGDEYYLFKNKRYCKYCGLGLEKAEKIEPKKVH